MTVTRRYTFKLYPSASQCDRMHKVRRGHCNLYNALIEHRRYMSRGGRKGVSFFDQCKELTALRRECPEWAEFYRACQEITAKRVDAAYQKFFANIKAKRAGATDRFSEPRFKAFKFYPGWGYGAHDKKGWRMVQTGPRSGRVTLRDVGTLRYRGCFPVDEVEIRTAEVIWRDEEWWLSVVARMEPRRKSGRAAVTIKLDLVDTFAKLGRRNGLTDGFLNDDPSNHSQLSEGYGLSPEGSPENGGDCGVFRPSDGSQPPEGSPENGGDCGRQGRRSPQGLPEDSPENGGDCGKADHFNGDTFPDGATKTGGDCGGEAVHEWLTLLDGAPKVGGACGNHVGKRGARNRRRKEIRAVRRRKNNMHVITARIARQARSVEVTRPASFKEITKSGRGNERSWGAMVKSKARLNRHILDQTPAAFLQALAYKVEEAGGAYAEITDDQPVADIGNKLVATAKKVRKVRATARRKAA